MDVMNVETIDNLTKAKINVYLSLIVEIIILYSIVLNKGIMNVLLVVKIELLVTINLNVKKMLKDVKFFKMTNLVENVMIQVK